MFTMSPDRVLSYYNKRGRHRLAERLRLSQYYLNWGSGRILPFVHLEQKGHQLRQGTDVGEAKVPHSLLLSFPVLQGVKVRPQVLTLMREM